MFVICGFFKTCITVGKSDHYNVYYNFRIWVKVYIYTGLWEVLGSFTALQSPQGSTWMLFVVIRACSLKKMALGLQ